MRRVLALGFAALCGCAPVQTRLGEVFSNSWREEGGTSIVVLEERLRSVHLPAGADVAVGVTDEGLVGVPLGGGSTWTFSHPLSSRPEIVGGVVVGVGGDELFCLRASTGRLLWTRPTGGLALVGAGDDGELTVVSLEDPGGLGSFLLAVDRSGQVLRQLESGKRLGKPAIVAGLTFIPWMDRYVTAYDVITGQEVTRLTFDMPVSSALVLSGSLFLGDAALTRFDASLVAAPERALRAEMPEREPFGRLRMLARPTERKSLLAGASDLVRGYARPSANGKPLGLDGERYVATYYRIAVGMTEGESRPQWVLAHDSDLLGGALFDGGVALCDASGRVLLLEESTGIEVAQLALDQPVRSCVVQADGLVRAQSGRTPLSLPEQIADAVSLSSTELEPVQHWLLQTLSGIDDESATRALVELSLDTRLKPALAASVAELLAQRRNGAEPMLRALRERLGTSSTLMASLPVGAMADALAAMNEPRAAPLLMRWLDDPRTNIDALPRIARALSLLATSAERTQLMTFFSMYRSEPGDERIERAVVSVAESLLRLGDVQSTELVVRAARDPLTASSLRPLLLPLLPSLPSAQDPRLIDELERHPQRRGK